MIEYLFCALRNLGRKKLRTFLTISGIAIGVASVIVIGAIGQGGRTAVSDELDSLGINGLNISAKSTNNKVYISDSDVTDCMRVKGVTAAMPIIMQSGSALLHSTEKNALYWGIGTDAKKIISINIIHGNMFTKADVDRHSDVCLVDDTFANDFFKRSNVTGEKVKVYLGNNYEELVIKGVVSSGSSVLSTLIGSYMPYFIYMPYTTAQDLRGVSGYDEIAIKTASNNNIDKIGDHIVNELSSGNVSYVASNMFKQKQKLSNLLNIVTLIISAVGAISLVVAGLGIMTVMTVSVSERTREIGIKKAIGAKKNVILLEFLFEALAISFLGGMIGILAGTGLSFLASSILHFSFGVRMSSVLISTGFAVTMGVLFGVYPAIKASQLKPVDALRHE